MGAGPYDHPSYLTRQMIPLGKSVAGANGTSCYKAFPTANMRIRNVAAVVVTAGTSATSGNKCILLNGTTSIGEIVLGTSAAGVIGTSGDINATITAGTTLSCKNGTDATGVYDVVAEMYIDPASGWTGTNN